MMYSNRLRLSQREPVHLLQPHAQRHRQAGDAAHIRQSRKRRQRDVGVCALPLRAQQCQAFLGMDTTTRKARHPLQRRHHLSQREPIAAAHRLYHPQAPVGVRGLRHAPGPGRCHCPTACGANQLVACQSDASLRVQGIAQLLQLVGGMVTRRDQEEPGQHAIRRWPGQQHRAALAGLLGARSPIAVKVDTVVTRELAHQCSGTLGGHGSAGPVAVTNPYKVSDALHQRGLVQQNRMISGHGGLAKGEHKCAGRPAQAFACIETCVFSANK